MITFNEFLNTDVEDFKLIFDFYLNFLGELSSRNFPFDEQIKLKGAGGKFLNTIGRISYIHSDQKEDYLKLIDEFHQELRYYRRSKDRPNFFKILIGDRSKIILLSLQDSFQNLYSGTLGLMNEVTNKAAYYDDLKINDFYKPENSNKERLKDLINEAIDLIKNDSCLTEKTKRFLAVLSG